MSTPALAKKSNHQANVVRVNDVFPHPNADRLELLNINGYQVVSGIGQFKKGDLAVYIQPDSVVPQTPAFEFIWKDHVGIDGVVPEKRRRITVRRFRKEYSEGLLMPLSDFMTEFRTHVQKESVKSGVHIDTLNLSEGDDVSDLLGITHYVPEFDRENTSADTAHAPRLRYPKTLRGWFFWALWKLGLRSHRDFAQEVSFDSPVYDVDALKNHKNWIQDGEEVQVTEKIHGSNARYVFYDGTFYAGSRQQWKKAGDNVWWKAVAQHPEIQEWCMQNPGIFLYGEVGPTQKGYRYGAEEGKTFFFAFDTFNPATGEWDWAGNAGFSLLAPTVYVGPFSEAVYGLAEGKTLVSGATGIREGVVVSVRSRRCKLKIVSNAFLEKDNQ
jgi:tRNA-binding EMAP/Myf-like protein